MHRSRRLITFGGGLFMRLLIVRVIVAIAMGCIAIVMSVTGPTGPNPGRTAVLTAIGVISWIVAVSWLVKRLSDSVEHLESAAQRVAAGDYSPIQRIPMPTPELEQLQTAFVSMIGKLDAARSALDVQMKEERAVREELQSLQRQVIRQERLAAVGLLVSGVA